MLKHKVRKPDVRGLPLCKDVGEGAYSMCESETYTARCDCSLLSFALFVSISPMCAVTVVDGKPMNSNKHATNDMTGEREGWGECSASADLCGLGRGHGN